MGDGDQDALGARLDEALHAGLEASQVDVSALVAGSRGRARQIRVQRLAALSTAAALVVALPVGYEMTRPHPGVTGPPAVLLPSTPQSPGRLGGPAGSPGPSPSIVDDRAIAAVPDLFAFAAQELPAALVATEPKSSSARGPLVGGQICDQPLTGQPLTGQPPNGQPPTGQAPVAGRQWQWDTGSSGQPRVTLTVTRWSADQAGAVFGALGADTAGTAACRWIEPQTEAALDLDSRAQVWAATSESAGRYVARVVLRSRDLLVGIQVTDPQSRAQALELTDDLAEIQLRRLALVATGTAR